MTLYPLRNNANRMLESGSLCHPSLRNMATVFMYEFQVVVSFVVWSGENKLNRVNQDSSSPEQQSKSIAKCVVLEC